MVSILWLEIAIQSDKMASRLSSKDSNVFLRMGYLTSPKKS